MKKTFLILGLILIITITKTSEKIIIPDEAIRFRVIANSNSNLDQTNKKKIAKKLSTNISTVLKNSNSIDDARIKLKENIPTFKAVVSEEAKKENYDIDVDVNYGNNYFPEKHYKGVTYKEGNYESLVVKLGEGKGENFWCVLFPPLCLLEAEESDTDEVEYKSFIKEIIDKYF